MKTLRIVLATALLTLSSGVALASDIEIKTVWIRGTVAGQQATGAFMDVTSKSGAALVGASSPVAGVTEVHEMTMDGNVMKMRAIPRLELPAGKVVKLEPGGYHVMLMALKQPLKAGDSVPLTLKIEGKDKKMETIELKADVRDLAAPPMTTEHKKH